MVPIILDVIFLESELVNVETYSGLDTRGSIEHLPPEGLNIVCL